MLPALLLKLLEKTTTGCVYKVIDKPSRGNIIIPGEVLPYMGYIGMCGLKGYSFSAALVENRVSILAISPSFW